VKRLEDCEYYRTDLGVLYCGDCLEIMSLLRENSIDMILTDPPYGINYLSNWTDNHAKLKNDGLKKWLEQMPLWLKEFKRVINEMGCCCCCCGGGGKTPVTAYFTIEAIKHFNLIQTLVWRKFIGLGWKYRPAYENIVILSKSKDKYNWFDTSKKAGNVIEGINQDIPNAEEHPTQKPVELMELLLSYHASAGMTILDPFSGGGSTLVACEKRNLKWIGIEISEKYCEIAKKRIEAEARQTKMFV
jgi:site-specific DNA-methyltransferase (adenine-specific)